jgi:hypothetical protein
VECVDVAVVIFINFKVHLLIPQRTCASATVRECAKTNAIDAHFSDGVLRILDTFEY